MHPDRYNLRYNREEEPLHAPNRQDHRHRQLGRHHSAQGDAGAAQCSQGIRLLPFDAEFAAQMEAAREVMRENRDVLQSLAE